MEGRPTYIACRRVQESIGVEGHRVVNHLPLSRNEQRYMRVKMGRILMSTFLHSLAC